jgi:hypothetical protein
MAVVSDIILPQQTTRQPVIWLCKNPACKGSRERYFEFQSDYPTCPKCGLEFPAVEKKSLIHWLITDPRGHFPGEGGIRYRIACHKDRDWLATVNDKVKGTVANGEAATGDIRSVNCPGCLALSNRIGKIAFGFNMRIK